MECMWKHLTTIQVLYIQPYMCAYQYRMILLNDRQQFDLSEIWSIWKAINELNESMLGVVYYSGNLKYAQYTMVLMYRF